MCWVNPPNSKQQPKKKKKKKKRMVKNIQDTRERERQRERKQSQTKRSSSNAKIEIHDLSPKIAITIIPIVIKICHFVLSMLLHSTLYNSCVLYRK